MKKYLVLLLSTLVFISCEPDPIDEDITLPEMEFVFNVMPDTAYIKIGDTLTLYAALSSITSTGIQLTNGTGEIRVSMGMAENIPKTSYDDNKAPENGSDYNIIIKNGNVKWGTSRKDQIRSFTTVPSEDSIIMHYKFVFIKRGLFNFSLQSSFYEGTKGKTRWNGSFGVKDTNWDFFQVPGETIPTPGEGNYYRSYWIAVTD